MKKPKTRPTTNHPTAFQFTLPLETGQQVTLAGSFNNWETSSLKLTKNDDSQWQIEVPLPAGIYEYRFIVDGRWLTDPNNPISVPNSYGEWNSVVSVPEPPLRKGNS